MDGENLTLLYHRTQNACCYQWLSHMYHYQYSYERNGIIVQRRHGGRILENFFLWPVFSICCVCCVVMFVALILLFHLLGPFRVNAADTKSV